jgi:hypothetical protein
MCTCRLFHSGLWPLALIVFGSAGAAIAARPSGDSARLSTYRQADGHDAFALMLRPTQAAPSAGPHDVVVLINTSASQIGPLRTKALETLKGLLAGFSPEDRVNLIAYDLEANPMTAGFVAPRGQDMNSARAKLGRREHLGASDMGKALTAAAAAFGGSSTADRSVILIGDGRSKANPLTAESLERTLTLLTDKHASVSSYGIGLAIDGQLLGVLASQTGGLVLDAAEFPAETAGADLAAAVRGQVLWPKTVRWPAAFREVFPKHTPPLRSDRESVVIGTLTGTGPFDVEMTFDTPAGEQQMSWKVPAAASDERNSYLARLVPAARVSGGLLLPLVNFESLAEARNHVNNTADRFAKLAAAALNSGDLVGADCMAREALAHAPQNSAAKQVLDKVAQGQAAPAPADDLNLAGPQPDLNDSQLLAAINARQKLIAQQMTAQVERSINDSRVQMTTDPDGVAGNLKFQLATVRQMPELRAEVREQLADRLQAALREADRRKVEVDHRNQQSRELRARATEQELLNQELLRKQAKLEQVMDRFRALMDERKYQDSQQIAIEGQKIDPNPIAPLSATVDSRTEGYLSDELALRITKQRAVVDTLWQVEKSQVPFPDDPPIVYPDAEVWRRLSELRKDRYSSMDLASQKPSEKKIIEALKSPTQFEFDDTPLDDVVKYLKDYHNIEIQLDMKALSDLGIEPTTPIKRDVKGISLRSAMKILLGQLGLTAVVHNEVLYITSEDTAKSPEFMTTKVYPVADLVLPIRTPPSSMGGMGGGMSGSSGSGSGGLNGILGGNQGGGNQGNNLGGMFNVPPNVLPQTHDQGR